MDLIEQVTEVSEEVITDKEVIKNLDECLGFSENPFEFFIKRVRDNEIESVENDDEIVKPIKIPSFINKSELINVNVDLLLRTIEFFLRERNLKMIFHKDTFSLHIFNEDYTINFKLDFYDNENDTRKYVMKVVDYTCKYGTIIGNYIINELIYFYQ